MAANKTQPNDASVEDFLQTIDNAKQRSDALELNAMLTEATGQQPVMWGASIVGYGNSQYIGSNGKAVDWFPIGFSPRKANLVLYQFGEMDPQLLAKLGKHKTGVGCLYIAKLDDVDRSVLRAIVDSSVVKARKSSNH